MFSAEAPATREFGLQRVEALPPELAEACQPDVDLLQRRRLDGVQASGPFRADGHEPGLPQYPQMLRHRGLRDAELGPDDPAHRTGGAAAEHSSLTAPMPGTVLRVLVTAGDVVEPRQPLVVLEAMKMETPLVAPYGTTVAEVHVAEGDHVARGAPLVELSE